VKMTNEQFDSLVARLERVEAKSPGAYRVRLALLAALGYSVIFGSIIVILGLMAAGLLLRTLAIKLEIFLGGLLVIILQSLWVKVKPPQGLPLKREDAPALFQMVEELQKTLKCPPVSCIVLSDELNAAMAYTPRLGVFGWMTHYLVVGLPIMQALSPEQFEAVICHELGHLSGRHDRFSHWIYMVQKTWFQLLNLLKTSRHRGAGPFVRFFEWYAPYFFAHALVRGRAVEYEADRYSAELVGARNAADALIAAQLKGSFLEERFWPELFARSIREPQPPEVYARDLPFALGANLVGDQADRWLQEALSAETGSLDTHPSLSERLRALGQVPRITPPLTLSAAQHFLASRERSLGETLDLAWRQNVGFSWRSHFQEAQEEQVRLQELNEKVLREPLEVGEAIQRAILVERYRTSEEALPIYRSALVLQPDDPSLLFGLGRILLTVNDPEGMRILKDAMDRDPDATVPSCKLIYSYLVNAGQQVEADSYRQRAVEHQRMLNEAKAERSRVDPKDKFIVHGLESSTVIGMQTCLACIREISGAWLARKEVKHWQDKPVYILVLKERFSMKSGGEKTKRALRQLVSNEVSLPPKTFIAILPWGGFRQVERLPGAQIYPVRRR
jgi:Zn-dependent protease with chaperone function